MTGALPVPVKGTFWVQEPHPPELSVMVRLPENVVAEVGVKVRLMVQVWPMATEAQPDEVNE